MTNLISTLSEFLRDLRAQKLRTTMTIFGIVWGTVAIVVLLAFGMGFKKQLSANMHGIGESIAIMFPGQTTKPFEGFGIGRGISLIEDDARLIATQVPDISRISPEYAQNDAQARVGENIIGTSIAGVYPVYGGMRNIIPEQGGRFIDDLDMAERRRVVMIGDEVRRLLFGDKEAVGQMVFLGQVPFLVVGVMQKKIQPSSYNRRDQDRVFIPASTFSSLYGATRINNIIMTTNDPMHSDETMQRVRDVLGKRYKFDPTDRDAVFIWDTAEFDRFFVVFFLAFNIFMGLIGSFTLAVGGIGVANIMYIVVQERIREIGIRRAVGARRSSIMLQFFSETMFIVALGSGIGFLIAVGITQAMALIPIKDFVGVPEISPAVGLITMLVLAAVGFAAGIMPARRAANVNVVECLRT